MQSILVLETSNRIKNAILMKYSIYIRNIRIGHTNKYFINY